MSQAKDERPFRWWRVERERGETIVLACQDDLVAAHSEAKGEGLAIFSGVGYRADDPDRRPKTFGWDWDTVFGVFEVSEPPRPRERLTEDR